MSRTRRKRRNTTLHIDVRESNFTKIHSALASHPDTLLTSSFQTAETNMDFHGSKVQSEIIFTWFKRMRASLIFLRFLQLNGFVAPFLHYNSCIFLNGTNVQQNLIRAQQMGGREVDLYSRYVSTASLTPWFSPPSKGLQSVSVGRGWCGVDRGLLYISKTPTQAWSSQTL